MREIIIDLETTVNGGPKGDSPEAHWLTNYVILTGWYDMRDNTYKTGRLSELRADLDKVQESERVRLIGHNVKFDLKYLQREWGFTYLSNFEVFDTMYHEYRQTGQLVKMVGLEELAKRRGVPVTKTMDLDAYLAAGGKMEDIPKDKLDRYLRTDLEMTMHIYSRQRADGMFEECDHYFIQALAEMELNGLPINRDKTQRRLLACDGEIAQCTGFMEGVISTWCEWNNGDTIEPKDFTELEGTKVRTIKPYAARTLSYLLTGHPQKGVNVGGKHWVVFRQGCDPFLTQDQINKVWGSKEPNHLGYPMDDNVLVAIRDSSSQGSMGHKVPTIVQEYRKQTKLADTYYRPMLETSQLQGHVYPKLNHAVTATIRLSSSNPNGQNMPPPARELVEPPDPNEEVLELDFKQLEMACVACASDDTNMINAIKNGDDLHYISGRDVMNWSTESDMTDEDRKIVKNVNFGVLYGGKAGGLSKQTGVSKSIINPLIGSFFNKFPRVQDYQQYVFEEVCNTMQGHEVINGESKYRGYYTLPISKHNAIKWTFIEQESPKWIQKKTGRSYSFSPQQTSNYPIQGFGAWVVLTFLEELWYEIRNQQYNNFSDCKFILTVHDSIIITGPKDQLKALKAISRALCGNIERICNNKLTLTLDHKYGRTWS